MIITKEKILKLFYCLFLICILIYLTYVSPINASVTSCSVSVNQSSLTGGVTTDLVFTINNTDSTSYNWIKIISPSSNFLINQAVASGWNASTNSNNSTLTGGSLSPSGSLSVTVGVTPIDEEVASENWIVQASDDSGSTTLNCSGNLGVSITASVEDNPPQISSIVISDITSSSVKVSWLTDEVSSSLLNYGLTESYGSTKSDSALVTSHSFSLESLSANTTYYFTASSTDNTGNTGSTGNINFTTAKAGLTSDPITIIKTLTPTPTPTPVPDTTKPTVLLSTDLSKPFAKSPQVLGVARDNKGVDKVEYSLDSGKNWLLVDRIASKGKVSTAFSFTPPLFDDGNYSLQVRSTDLSGNKGLTKIYTIIIDRLSPQVSGVLFSLGPQVINPDINGTILTLVNQQIKITLSEVGGSTEVSLIAENVETKKSKKISLRKNTDNGLWSNTFSLEEEGKYQLKFTAIDGADNKTERLLNEVIVSKKGVIKGSEGPLADSLVSVYYQEPKSKIWQLWDSKPYSQKNPQRTSSDGSYNLLLPPGKYYLEIKASGYQVLNSEFFEIIEAGPINANFSLKQLNIIFSIGFIKIYLPDFSVLYAPFKNNLSENESNSSNLFDKEIPFFSLPKANNSQFTSESLKGKPGVITFLNTWSPSSTEQISILDKFSRNQNFNSATIIEGEKLSKVYVFQKRGEYKAELISDSDATLALPYNLSSLPVHYLIDRKGVIKNVMYGTLSEQELSDNLINITE